MGRYCYLWQLWDALGWSLWLPGGASFNWSFSWILQINTCVEKYLTCPRNHDISWIPRNLSFHYILFHEKGLQTMLWHHNARVDSQQRWKQTRFRICFHLWCELTSTMNVTERQVSWNSWKLARTSTATQNSSLSAATAGRSGNSSNIRGVMGQHQLTLRQSNYIPVSNNAFGWWYNRLCWSYKTVKVELSLFNTYKVFTGACICEYMFIYKELGHTDHIWIFHDVFHTTRRCCKGLRVICLINPTTYVCD